MAFLSPAAHGATLGEERSPAIQGEREQYGKKRRRGRGAGWGAH